VTRDELLARSPLWAALPAASRAELAARATRRKFKKGQRLLGAGDRAVVTLVLGRADLIAADGAVVRSVTPPMTIGVSVAIGAAASAELYAAEAGELLSIPGEAVAATLRRHPDAAVAALVHLADVVAQLSETLEVMRTHGLALRLRYALAVLAQGRRELAITHDELAAAVGGTRANVSRALARLEAEGVVRRRRGRIEIAG
jgi:CRP-like cAMP-binding protein